MAWAGRDKPITVSQLPAAAQQTLRTHFGEKKVALVKKEYDILSSSYDVVFTDGTKIEFRSNGAWEEVDCKQGQVPAKLVPEAIGKFVSTHYQGQGIRKMEHDEKRYEVDLSSGLEITFDDQFRVIDIDR